MRSEGLNDTAMTGFSTALSVASDAPKESSRTGAQMQKDGVLSDALSGGKRQQGRRKKKAKRTNQPSAARRVLIAVERIIVRGEGGGGEQAQVVL